ncbi:serine protease gd [Aphomia sociella]
MYLKHYIVLCFLLISVNSECDNYLRCLGDFIHDFFGTNKNTTDIETHTSNSTYYEVKTVNDSDFQKILNDFTSLFNNESDHHRSEFESSTITKQTDDNKTRIIIKLFEFDDTPKGFEVNSNITTEQTDNVDLTKEIPININNPIDSPVTNNVIKDVNNLVDILESFEDNEVSLDGGYDENNTDYPNIDYIELYQDATIEYSNVAPTQAPKSDDVTENVKEIDNIIDYSAVIQNEDTSNNIASDQVYSICEGNLTQGVYPWIATIFVKNTTIDNQFEYYCDGALVSEKVILTAARCVTTSPTISTIDPQDLIIVLGKKSLHSMNGNEKVHKIKTINLHDNYTVEDGVAKNDLAVLILEEPADFSNAIGAACMFGEQEVVTDYKETGTTAWSLSGDLTPIYFDKEKSRACNQRNKVENTFCATYGDDVPLCPSYGGLHATKHTDDKWNLHGIRTGDPTARRICVERDIKYTSLIDYVDWIVVNIQSNKY